ncbi:MAG: hypothetical protein ACRDHW_15890, partial [Ktedonobacteraceae bacterium]
MKNTIVPNDLDELSALSRLGDTASRIAALPQTSSAHMAAVSPTRSYQPYPWSLLNSILDIVDDKLPGRAGQVQRVFSYLFFGGAAAVVNLLAFAIML